MEQAPPPYQPDLTSNLPSVPRDHVSNLEPNSPRHLPALEPTLSHDSQPGPDNPMNTRRYSNSNHSHHDMRYSSGITLQPLRFPQVPEHGPVALALDSTSPRELSASSEEHDDRVAAEALLGLGKMSTPHSHHRQPSHPDIPHMRASGYDTDLKYYDIVENVRSGPQRDEPEPLLSLLTSSHPWLGGTINSSVSAYSSTKQYTPRFLQRGADIVENTVGAVGRRTGVEGGIRRYLDSRRPSEVDLNAASRKADHAPDLSRPGSAKDSIDSLPAYDSNRSPSYEEAVQPQSDSLTSRPRPPINRSWSTQLMISTSGLGAALNETSLQSLKYCLAILNRANGHVRNLMEALRNLLARYAEWSHQSSRSSDANDDAMDIDQPLDQSNTAAGKIAQEIRKLNHEIWQTFHNVVNYVSRYTGGALPENASTIVKWQLMSVPSRWHRAVRSSNRQNGSQASSSPPAEATVDGQPGQDEAVSSANRMLAFAMEGLDMMDQVSGVVDSTIVSAEKWLDSMGRRKREQQQNGGHSPGAGVSSGEDIGLPLPVQAQEKPLA